MTKLTSKDVLHVAKLAHLDLSPEQAAGHLESFNQILSYIEKLNELDTETIEEASQVFPSEHPDGTPQAQDECQLSLSSEEATKNAPACEEGFFKIPRVIET